MFVYLDYPGDEPTWASELRREVLAYSPGVVIQEHAIGPEFSLVEPRESANKMREVLRLDETLWMVFEEALATLEAADLCNNTSRMVWKDLYFLIRSDAVICDTSSTNEIPLIASYLDIPVIAISFHPLGIHPWLAHCASITLNSPSTTQQILQYVPNSKEDSQE